VFNRFEEMMKKTAPEKSYEHSVSDVWDAKRGRVAV
jgi:hypothetical protein